MPSPSPGACSESQSQHISHALGSYAETSRLGPERVTLSHTASFTLESRRQLLSVWVSGSEVDALI